MSVYLFPIIEFTQIVAIHAISEVLYSIRKHISAQLQTSFGFWNSLSTIFDMDSSHEVLLINQLNTWCTTESFRCG